MKLEVECDSNNNYLLKKIASFIGHQDLGINPVMTADRIPIYYNQQPNNGLVWNNY